MDKNYRQNRADRPYKKTFNGTNNNKGNYDKDKPKVFRADPRRVSLFAYTDVIRNGAYTQLALDKQLSANKSLTEDDARLASRIFYTAVENKLKTEYIINQFLKRETSPLLMDILVIACTQIFLMDKIPDFPAVDEAVKLTGKLMPEMKGFVNGTLRNILRARDAGTIIYPNKDEDVVKYLSIEYSCSEELVKKLIDTFGTDKAEELLKYAPDERYITLRPNNIRISDAEFRKYLTDKQITWEEGSLPETVRVINAKDITDSNAFKNGIFSIQGESSIIAAMATEPKPGQTILDACAAPGGKTAYIAEKMKNTGRVHAWDLHDHRVKLVANQMKRLRLDNVRPAARDSSVFYEQYENMFDAVLLDVPCTGVGVISNKPDIKYSFSEKKLNSLIEIQQKILSECSKYVAPGGKLVYSTCSILPDENEKQIDKFLQSNKEFVRAEKCAWLPQQYKDKFKGGNITFLPPETNMDGFFIQVLIKR